MEDFPGERIPFWATRQFRWLVFVLIVAVAAVAVLILKVVPSLEPRKLDLPEGTKPVATLSTLADLTKVGKAPHGDLLAGVRDGTPSNEADPVYLDLVRKLRDVKASDLASEAVHIHYGLFAKDPGALRGRVARVIALIIDDVTATPLVLDEGTVDWIYRTHLLDPSGNEGYIVDILEKPAGLGRRDLVLLNGVFVKMATYEGRQEQTITAPLLVGRELLRLEERGAVEAWEERMTYVAGAIAALLLLGMTLWAFFFARSRGAAPPRRLLPARPLPPRVQAPAPPRAGAPAGDGAPRKLAARPPLLRRRTEHAAAGRRSPVLHLTVLGVLLVAAMGYKFFSGREKEKDLDPVEAARLAHDKVLDVESKTWSRGEPLGPEDLRSIRASLRTLIAGSEALNERLRALENEGKWASDESKANALRLREIMLWVLDASAVTEAAGAGGDPSSAGLFIPHRLALKKLEAAEAELGALEGGSQGTPERLAALKAVFEDSRGTFTGLAARVKEGLAREDLTPAQLPFLGTLDANVARAADGARRVEALLAKPRG